MAPPNSVYRRARRFDGGVAADGIIISNSTSAPLAIEKDSSYCRVIFVITPKSSTEEWVLLKASRTVTTAQGFDVGYSASANKLIFMCADNTGSGNYFGFGCTADLTVDTTYRITLTYVEGTTYTILIEELDTDGNTVNSSMPTVTTEAVGTGDGGIAYAAHQSVCLGQSNNNSLLGSKALTYKGTGWVGGTGNYCNHLIHYLGIERTTAGVLDAEFLFEEALTATVPTEEVGLCAGIAFIGAIGTPAVAAAELTVTETVSTDPITDTDAYDAGPMALNDTVSVTITNTGDCIAWLDAITDAGGDLAYSSVYDFPRWLYPGATLALVFTQGGTGGTGGATLEAFGASGTDTDWADDVTPFGDFQISLTYSAPQAEHAIDMRARTRRSMREFRAGSVA